MYGPEWTGIHFVACIVPPPPPMQGPSGEGAVPGVPGPPGEMGDPGQPGGRGLAGLFVSFFGRDLVVDNYDNNNTQLLYNTNYN